MSTSTIAVLRYEEMEGNTGPLCPTAAHPRFLVPKQITEYNHKINGLSKKHSILKEKRAIIARDTRFLA